jgi:hypothetical protein
LQLEVLHSRILCCLLLGELPKNNSDTSPRNFYSKQHLQSNPIGYDQKKKSILQKFVHLVDSSPFQYFDLPPGGPLVVTGPDGAAKRY